MADNPDELFDNVDPSDRVIGRARRADVHANGLLHRAVHILITRSNGDIFLQKRSMEKDCHPGTWDSSASGHLDSGEGYAEAAVRELREELGIQIEALAEVGALSASEVTGMEFVKIYHATHEGPFILHPSEIDEGRWVAINELHRWISGNPGDFAPCFIEVFHQSEPVLSQG